MKERPILFSAPMVRALLAGTKTQTRRAVALPRKRHGFVMLNTGAGWWPYQSDDGESELCNDGMEHPYSCPYGQHGDRLWVRENGWERPFRSARDMREGADTWPRYEYDAEPVCCWEDGELKRLGWKRRPSIHMPRWASRILLEVTAVRVERLQDMEGQGAYPGESDALAEGVHRIHHGRGDYYYSAFRDEPNPKNWCDPTDAFRELWEQINGADSWAANPWVWVVEFKRVQP